MTNKRTILVISTAVIAVIAVALILTLPKPVVYSPVKEDKIKLLAHKLAERYGCEMPSVYYDYEVKGDIVLTCDEVHEVYIHGYKVIICKYGVYRRDGMIAPIALDCDVIIKTS